MRTLFLAAFLALPALAQDANVQPFHVAPSPILLDATADTAGHGAATASFTMPFTIGPDANILTGAANGYAINVLVDSVTWGSQKATIDATVGQGGVYTLSFFHLLNPTIGSGNLTIYWNTAVTEWAVGAATWKNVNPTWPTGELQTLFLNPSDTMQNTLSAQSGDIIVQAVGWYQGNDVKEYGTNQSELWHTTYLNNYAGTAASYRPYPDTSVIHYSPALRNGGFETAGTAPEPFAIWSRTIAGSSTVIDTSDAHSSGHAARFYSDGSASIAQLHQPNATTIGKTYTLSAWAKKLSGSPCIIQFTNDVTWNKLHTLTSGTWEAISHTFVADGTSLVAKCSEASTSFILDDLRLFEHVSVITRYNASGNIQNAIACVLLNANPHTPPTAYSNPGGFGNRSSIITTSSSSGLWARGSAATLVDGSMVADPYFVVGNTADRWIQFDFGSPQIIQEVTWYTSNTQTFGVWRWQGSVNGTDWDNVGDTFTFGGLAQVQTSMSVNTTSYRYYRIYGVSGTLNQSPDHKEVNFKLIAG